MKYNKKNIPHYIGMWNSIHPKYYTHYSKLYKTWGVYCTVNEERPLKDATLSQMLDFLNNDDLGVVNLDSKP